MRDHTRRFRLSAAVSAALVASGFCTAAFAQAAAPASAPVPTAGDPPGRVGVLSRTAGTVSFHGADATQWSAATLNAPVTSGDSFWTEPQAEADIDIGPMRLTLAPETEFDIATLDDRTLAATEVRGELYVHRRAAASGETTRITTPRATVTLIGAGRFDIVAGDAAHPTVVTVLDGAAELSGANLSLRLGAHQAATITGSASFVAAVAAAGEDAFLREQLARERPVVVAPNAPAVPVPPVVNQMTGGDALAAAGQWSDAPGYGAVWYPPVPIGWVPFRNGHWIWLAPWGWTWVDDAPWGFAPSHYGRWLDLGNRWAWMPMPLAPAGQPATLGAPVYTPAMVSFMHPAAGEAAGAAVGWAPLGPREPYIPPYRTSDRYLAQVNAINMAHVGAIVAARANPPAFDRLANQQAATIVPATAMTQSAPIAARAEATPPQALASARAAAAPPLAPTLQTRGVTPSVARQYGLGAPPGGLAPAPAAPGPDLRPRDPQFGRGPVRPPAEPAGLATPGSADLLLRPRPVPGGSVLPEAPTPAHPAAPPPAAALAPTRPYEPIVPPPTAPRPPQPQVARPETPLPQVIEPTPQIAAPRPAGPSQEAPPRPEPPGIAAEPRPVSPPRGAERAAPAFSRPAPMPARPAFPQRPGEP